MSPSSASARGCKLRTRSTPSVSGWKACRWRSSWLLPASHPHPRTAPRSPLPAPRPAEGRSRRRSPPANAENLLSSGRTSCSQPRSNSSSPVSPSSVAAARWKPQRRSATPIWTTCSRSSTRACCASPRAATGCWRRCGSSPANALAASRRGDELAQRHAQHFLELAERAEPELWAQNTDAWLPRLDPRPRNSGWPQLGHPRGKRGLPCGSLSWPLSVLGDSGSARRGVVVARQALALPGRVQPSARAKALVAAGRATSWLLGPGGRHPTSRRLPSCLVSSATSKG